MSYTGNTKFIFVTGGVISGLGKGVSAASLGRLLKSRGFSVFVQKLDPYLNVDPGVMSPYEHGEVYVTNDGGETDLDLGHYERFIGTSVTKESNYTSGRIYQEILAKERKGGFDGKTVQVVPHVTDHIQKITTDLAEKHKPDFLITEIGGTVGDIESSPFIHAIAQMNSKYEKSVFFLHVTYVTYLHASEEFKTKPTQNSIANLRSFGIKPSMIFLRSHEELDDATIAKVAINSFLNVESVISLHDHKSIYNIPLYLEDKKVADKVLKYFKMKLVKPDLENWKELVRLIEKESSTTLNIAMFGKYAEFPDAYKSINEALNISGIYKNVKIDLHFLSTETINPKNVTEEVEKYDGIVILPGFGKRGFEGKVTIAQHAREANVPTLGICLGFQAMSVAQARMKGLKDANSAEFADEGHLILDFLEGKKADDPLGGSLRLGLYDIEIKKNSIAHKIYESTLIQERHRHRFEIQEKYRKQIEDKDFIFSGNHPELKVAEICEAPNLDFYIGTQYHPEFTSNPLTSHKLFDAFISATLESKFNLEIDTTTILSVKK